MTAKRLRSFGILLRRTLVRNPLLSTAAAIHASWCRTGAPSMTFDTWLAFATASAILVLIPGPTVLLVVSYALGQGWRTALPMAVGVALGDFTAMSLSMLGVGAMLSASAGVFTTLKWLGAAYLVWLGIKLWRAGGALDSNPRTDAVSTAKMLGHAW